MIKNLDTQLVQLMGKVADKVEDLLLMGRLRRLEQGAA